MVLSNKFKEISVEVICFLYILLFVYAAINKILDFENFQVQLAQSPLLSAFAGPISYMVLVVEVVIAVLLCFQKFKKAGLYAGFSLMVMFTGYIVIILEYSPFIPCSCGGVLEKMTWNQHLVFNAIFVVLGGLALYWFPRVLHTKHNQKKIIVSLVASVVIPIAFLVAAFLLSEDMMQKRNNFTRRFPHHPVLFQYKTKLKYGSYYFAGVDENYIYLGNLQYPTTITLFNHSLHLQREIAIIVPDLERTYKDLKLVVQSSNFYLYDGSSTFVYTGKVADGKAKLWTENQAYFNRFIPIDSTTAAIRTINASSKETVLGILQPKNESPLILNEFLLDKQIDGVFDTDGYLIYNEQTQTLIYTYAYRNQFIVTNKLLGQKSLGNTIDTTSKVKIDVRYLSSLNASLIASPARIVNKRTSTYGPYLYVNSALIGKYEPREIWNSASIVDVYEIETKKYLLSFYLYDEEGIKLTDFLVSRKKIFVIAGKVLSAYSLQNPGFSVVTR
ncbi:MAG: MauE/DoxX family redox-associated membrane protein [Candidatus Saccharimonadaceae bacterium]